MTPRNDVPLSGGQRPQAKRGNVGADAIGRIKMLIAAGAVAGALGGRALSAQQNVTDAAQSNISDSTVAALVQSATPTSTPRAIASLDQALQTTPTTQATVTITTPTAAANVAQANNAAANTLTPTAQASTPPVEPTNTPSPQATATVAQPTAVPTAKAFTTTKSSR